MANFEVSGLAPDTVYNTLLTKGITASEATRFIGDWINFVSGGPRTFNYVQDFPETQPACAPNFARKFAHHDWVDGESVVQAQQTTGEDGFNARFHAIEGDLDSLGANLAKTFGCLAEMRKSLFALLAEIKTELNRIDADLGRLTGPVVSPFPGGIVQAGTKFLGTTTVGEQQMTMWQSSQGIVLLPGVTAIHADPGNDPRANRAGQLAGFVTQNQNLITQAFGNQAFTKEQFLSKFGDQKAPDGTPVKQLLDVVPSGVSFASADVLVNDVTSREAAALRTTAGATGALAEALGIDAPSGSVGSASIEKFNAIPAPARAALIQAGIDTMDKLAATKPEVVAKAFATAGVTGMSNTDIAVFTTKAKTLVQLQR